MTDIDKCRAGFEAWRQSLGEEAEDLRHDGDGYYMYDANQAWHGWQAAWNAAQPKPPAANTVRVRIPALVSSEGEWCAQRWGEESDATAVAMLHDFQFSDDAKLRLVWITADVPKPEVAEVRGEVTT